MKLKPWNKWQRFRWEFRRQFRRPTLEEAAADGIDWDDVTDFDGSPLPEIIAEHKEWIAGHRKKWDERVASEWAELTKFLMRGNASGALASLTLIGVQANVGATSSGFVFWPFLCFLLGLFAVTAMPLLRAIEGRMHRDTFNGSTIENFEFCELPPPIFETLIKIAPRVSLTLFILGSAMGVFAIWTVTS
ncbi:MAG: hypothetical protein AB7G62_20630 [Magnetospirillum sp.]